ncbi:MAG: radical SAM protein [Candidatus Omnitrophica bacterium]|nr:radical SAM protein [Candidatus Omnitrophota bacterium]
MDLNNKCNLRCRMCYFALDLSKQPNVVMDIPLFKKIAAEVFPKAVQVNLSCAAEPLLIPNFTDYLKILKTYDVPTTLIVTNAFLLDETKALAVMESGLTYIDVSMDGATKSTYEKVRVGSNFERVVDNLRKLKHLKESSGRTNPLVYFDYTLMRSNFKELPEFLRLAKELGASQVRANHLIPFPQLKVMGESLIHCRKEANDIFDETRHLADEIGIQVFLPKNFDLSKDINGAPIINKPACSVPQDSIFIVSDGSAVPCAWFSFEKWRAGNFKDQNFEEIWNGPVYTELRDLFQSRKYTEYCVNCPVYGDENIDTYVFNERKRDDVINIASRNV